MYSVRMTRVNISMPDDIYRQARAAGLNISQLAQRAVGGEIDRLDRIAGLDAYLAELEVELGPVSDAERAKARDWADRALGPQPRRHSA